VDWVNYPGLPSHSHYQAAKKYLPKAPAPFWDSACGEASRPASSSLTRFKLASHLANVGDAKTLVIHPASTTHSQLSVEDQSRPAVTP